MEFEGSRAEENIPLEDRTVWAEDNKEGFWAETSFMDDLWEDIYHDDDSVPILHKATTKGRLRGKGKSLEQQLKEAKRVKRIFLLQLYDKQLDPSYGEEANLLFNRLGFRSEREGIQNVLLFDGDVVATWVEGKGYTKNKDSPRFEEFERLVLESIKEFDATTLGKFEREAEEKLGFENETPKNLMREYNRRVARMRLGLTKTERLLLT